MSVYIDQIFNEGLGKTIYLPIKKLIDRKIKKAKTNIVLTFIAKFIYLIFTLSIISVYIYSSWPL